MSVRVDAKFWWSIVITPFSRSHSMEDPCWEKNLTSLFRSVMSGTLRKVTGSLVNRVAQKTGRTAFLLPEGVMVPERGLPPWTMRSDIDGSVASGMEGGKADLCEGGVWLGGWKRWWTD